MELSNLCKLASKEKRQAGYQVPLEIVEHVNSINQYPKDSYEADHVKNHGRYACYMYEYQYENNFAAFDEGAKVLSQLLNNFTNFTGVDYTDESKIQALAEKRGKAIVLLTTLSVIYQRFYTFLTDILEEPYRSDFCNINQPQFSVYLQDVDASVIFSTGDPVEPSHNLGTCILVKLIDRGTSIGFEKAKVVYTHETAGLASFDIACEFWVEKI